MSYARSFLLGGVVAGMLASVALPAAADGGRHRIARTGFTMEVPDCRHTGYNDIDG